jgi:soluble lytic murein transglycosylase-like protein
VTPSQVEDLALEHGVDPGLAAAVARQESGFNNGLVSSANARGVMQILPRTWDFVERRLAGHRLNPASALENMHAGVMYLGHLLRETGSNERQAAAGYYQGLGSVRRIGMLPETRRYVADVMALKARFGRP